MVLAVAYVVDMVYGVYDGCVGDCVLKKEQHKSLKLVCVVVVVAVVVRGGAMGVC